MTPGWNKARLGLWAVVLTVGTVLASSSDAHAQVRGRNAAQRPAAARDVANRAPHRSPLSASQMRARLAERARAAGIRTYERRLANGTRRTYTNPSGTDQLRAMEQMLPKGSNVLEIVHMGTRRVQHTMAIFDRQMVHTQYITGTGKLASTQLGTRSSAIQQQDVQRSDSTHRCRGGVTSHHACGGARRAGSRASGGSQMGERASSRCVG